MLRKVREVSSQNSLNEELSDFAQDMKGLAIVSSGAPCGTCYHFGMLLMCSATSLVNLLRSIADTCLNQDDSGICTVFDQYF